MRLIMFVVIHMPSLVILSCLYHDNALFTRLYAMISVVLIESNMDCAICSCADNNLYCATLYYRSSYISYYCQLHD